MLRLFTLVIVAVAFIYAIEGDSIDKKCKPVDCGGKLINCQYGYRKQDGCEICKCYNPCNPPEKVMICGPNEKCFVDKTSNGTFVARCDPLRSKRTDKACQEEKAVGTCKGTFKRFYYNSAVNKCEQFIYTGCEGNDNNFEVRDKCEATCVA